MCVIVHYRMCYSVSVCVTDPVAVVVDVDGEVLVHGGEGGSVLQLLGAQPAVHHVVMKSVQQLDVHVAHQSVQDLLQHVDNRHNSQSARTQKYTTVQGKQIHQVLSKLAHLKMFVIKSILTLHHTITGY